MSREVAGTEKCFRKINLGLNDRLIDKSIVSLTVKEMSVLFLFFFKTTQSWFIVQFVLVLNWLTFWPNYFLKDGMTLFLMVFSKLTNMVLRPLIFVCVCVILNSMLTGEKRKTYLSQQNYLISQECLIFQERLYQFLLVLCNIWKVALPFYFNWECQNTLKNEIDTRGNLAL